MIQYRRLCEDELCRELFRDFIRHQKVVDCWRRENGVWMVKPDPFIDDWSEEDYQTLVACLKNTVRTGGFVCGAFCGGDTKDSALEVSVPEGLVPESFALHGAVLKGFVSVESGLFGGEQKYLDLSSIHVSEDMRGKGIGRELFCAAKKWAAENGAGKLYISAHSAVESQAFYRAMGCVEAQVYNREHVEKEPYDCQLECRLEEA